MSIRMEDLDESFRGDAETLIAVCNAQALRFIIFCTLRTQAEQVALFAQGRESLEVVNQLRAKAGYKPIVVLYNSRGEPYSDNDYIVTKTDGIIKKSPHQGGTAIDLVALDNKGHPSWNYANPNVYGVYRKIAENAKALGLDPGFFWEGDFKDPPHIQKGREGY